MRFSGLIVLIFLASCAASNSGDSYEASSPEQFRQFVGRFQPIRLPFVYRMDWSKEQKLGKLLRLDPATSDSLFIASDDVVYGYGMLPDTSSYFGLVYYYPADSYYPVLATYSKEGNLISKEPLIVQGCGGDCGLLSCSSTAILKADGAIFCADTVIYRYQCNEQGDTIPNSAKGFVHIKKGQLLRNGKLDMNREKKVELKPGAVF